MGQYRIRKAGPGETPGYYSKHQLALKRFAEGGAQEDNSMNLSQMLPQISNTIASAILQSGDPENTDIRPIMAQMSSKLRESGVEPSAIESLVSAAGKQALQLVANMLDQQKSNEEETPEEQTTEVAEEPTVTEAPMDYGYYDQSAATQGGEDDQVIDELLMQYGGTNGKRKFMREAMSHLNKAAEGMQQQSSNSASLRGTADDIQGNSLSSKHTFIPAVKQTAQYEVNKKFAEDQYNQMMGQQYKSGGESRRIRRANQAIFGTPHSLPGANVNYEFGPLGGVRHASVEFNPAMMQSMFGVQSVMPGMISGQNGSYTPTYQIKGTRVKSSSETQAAQDAKAVNASTMGKVATDTPNSEATSAGRTIEQMRADALKYGNVEYNNGSSGWSAGTANSELNQGTNGNGRSGGNNAGSSTRPTVPNPVRTPSPVVIPKNSNLPVNPVSNKKPGKTMYLTIPGKTSVYYQDKNGWHFVNKEGEHGLVTDPDTKRKLGTAIVKKNKELSTKFYNEKIGNSIAAQAERLPQAAQADDELITNIALGFMPNPFSGSSAVSNLGTKLLGAGESAGAKAIGAGGKGILNPGQSMLNPGQGMLNAGQRMLNPPAGYQYQLGFEEGGSINPELYKYVYGGDDFSQEDLDYDNSKDVTDAYFRDGGLYHFQGTGDSQVSQTNTTQPVRGLTKEDVEKMFEEYGKKMQMQQNPYGQQSYTQGSFGSAGYGQPMWGRPMYGQGYTGMMGQYGNMFSPFRKDFKYLTPYGQGNNMAINPMSVMAGSMANIQKSGMVPTKFSYGKERKQDGNWFERKLGFNKDRVWTIDYSKPNAGQPQSGTNMQTQMSTQPKAETIEDPKLRYMHESLTAPSNSRMPVGFPANTAGPRNTFQDGGVEFEGYNEDSPWLGEKYQDLGVALNKGNLSLSAGNYFPKQVNLPTGFINPYVGVDYALKNNNSVGFEATPGYIGASFRKTFDEGGDVDEYAIAGEINNQVNPIKTNTPTEMKSSVTSNIQNKMNECSEEEKLDPNSPCYEKQTEQLKFKEETARTFDPMAAKNLGLFAGRNIADTANQLQDYKNVYVPNMNKLIYGRGPGQQRVNTGIYEENTGARNYTGFQGVVKKGGSTGLRENGEYNLTMDEISEILKAGGKIEFL